MTILFHNSRQDALEQRRKLDCLLLRGSHVPNPAEILPEKVASTIANLFFKRAGVECDKEDLELVHLRAATEDSPKSAFVRSVNITYGYNKRISQHSAVKRLRDCHFQCSSIFRFVDRDLRMKVWASKAFAKKNGLFMEEWLTVTRRKIFLKCKDLKSKGLIKDVMTKAGDVFALILKEEDVEQQVEGDPQVEKILVVTDTQFEQLLKRTKGVLDEEDEEEVEKKVLYSNDKGIKE